MSNIIDWLLTGNHIVLLLTLAAFSCILAILYIHLFIIREKEEQYFNAIKNDTKPPSN